MDFSDTPDAAYRATLGSWREEQVGGDTRVIPDFTIPMATDFSFRSLEADEPAPGDFEGLFKPGSSDWKTYFSTRKVVTRVLPSGKRVASVTSNVADALGRFGPTKGGVDVGSGRPKSYEVAHLLTDASLIAKFSLTGAFAARAKNLAVVDTMRAARLLQDHVRSFEGYERAVVSVGKYAGSWKAARDCIKLYAARFPMTSVRTDACVISDKIFMYGDSEVVDWRVFGPVSCAGLVQMVHKMVEATTCETVMFAFGPELTILDIDIHDGTEVMCPVKECHAGSHDDLPSGADVAVGAFLSVDGKQALLDLCQACETLAVDGEDVATAVRITSRYVLINAHVVREGGVITSNGQQVFPHRMLSSDLWLAKSVGPETAWHLRRPDEGEQVMLCYRRHEQLQILGPLRVSSVSSETLTLEKHPGMQPGVSGAAVVALRDFAFVGLHDAVAMRKALSAAFTPAMFTDVCSMSDAGDNSHASAREDGGSVYARMKDRGLGKVVDSAMSAVLPLYSGSEHVGMGFPVGSRVFTTCDPDAQPLALEPGGKPLVFSREGPYYAAQDAVVRAGPAVLRQPSYGEKVFVVGRDEEGEYFSTSVAKVVHVGVGATTFQVSGLETSGALPLQGGLVVSGVDAAVLGVFAVRVFDTKKGELVVCRAMPDGEVPEQVEQPAAAIQRIFPFLRPGTWPEGVPAAVLTHASAGESSVIAHAMVGDAAMRTHLMVRLLESGVPTSKWSGFVQSDQCNAAQASACERLGLGMAIRVGGGLVLSSGSKVFADVMEALAGAVYLHETVETFESFCLTVGALRAEYVG